MLHLYAQSVLADVFHTDASSTYHEALSIFEVAFVLAFSNSVEALSKS